MPIAGSSSRRSTLLTGVSFFLLFAANTQAAEFQSSIDLGSLDGATGFRLTGDAIIGNGRSGYSVSAAGDVNGDGLGDVIVGAPLLGEGKSYVVFGKNSGLGSNIELSSLNGMSGFRVVGDPVGGARSGMSVAGAGDVNGDGFADLIVGDYFYGSPNPGAAYVVFGKASFASQSSVDLSGLNGATGFRLDGKGGSDIAGRAVSGAGDVNNDGFDDVVVGAPASGIGGVAYVVFGKASFSGQSSIELSSLNGATGFQLVGETAGDRAGYAVAAAGDVNGDGFGDVIVGADLYGSGNPGAAYVVFGKASGFVSNISLSALGGASGFRLTGGALGDTAGHSVSGAGDVNGDGFDDVLVGAYEFGASRGASHVVFGKATFAGQSSISLSSLNGSTGFSLSGGANGDASGRAVSTAGDVNGDGFADLIMGSHRYASADRGAAHVVFGKASGFASNIELSILDGTTGFRLVGEADQDYAGRSVSDAGDVNGDGFGDIIVGADGYGTNAKGRTYVVYGRAPLESVTRIGSRAKQTIRGGAFADILVATDSGDVLEGRDSGDILVGSIGTTASYAHAGSAVLVSLISGAINGGAANGDSFFSIANVEGSEHNDVLTGNGAANLITGGIGKDSLRGGGGKDTFIYRLSAESPAGSANSDTVLDFNPGSGSTVVDKIDVLQIDAKTGIGGNQAFSFIGTTAFSKPGQLRIKKTSAGIVVQGNTTGNSGAEFEILLRSLKSTAAFSAKDFKL